MIEAVNSVVANASLIRVSAEQIDVARSDEAREPAATPQAPYISPYISVDQTANVAVIQIRDSETGDVLTQFPSESRIQARQELEAAPSESGGAVAQAVVSESSSESLGGGTFSAEAISSIQSTPVSNGVAEAQIASVALSTGAQSGGVSTASDGVNVTA